MMPWCCGSLGMDTTSEKPSTGRKKMTRLAGEFSHEPLLYSWYLVLNQGQLKLIFW